MTEEEERWKRREQIEKREEERKTEGPERRDRRRERIWKKGNRKRNKRKSEKDTPSELARGPRPQRQNWSSATPPTPRQ